MILAQLLNRIKRHRACGQMFLGRRATQALTFNHAGDASSAPRFIPAELALLASPDSRAAPGEDPASADVVSEQMLPQPMRMPYEGDQTSAPAASSRTITPSLPASRAANAPAPPSGASTASPDEASPQQQASDGSGATYRPPTFAEMRETLLALREKQARAGNRDTPRAPAMQPGASDAKPPTRPLPLGRRVTHLPGFNPDTGAPPAAVVTGAPPAAVVESPVPSTAQAEEPAATMPAPRAPSPSSVESAPEVRQSGHASEASVPSATPEASVPSATPGESAAAGQEAVASAPGHAMPESGATSAAIEPLPDTAPPMINTSVSRRATSPPATDAFDLAVETPGTTRSQSPATHRDDGDTTVGNVSSEASVTDVREPGAGLAAIVRAPASSTPIDAPDRSVAPPVGRGTDVAVFNRLSGSAGFQTPSDATRNASEHERKSAINVESTPPLEPVTGQTTAGVPLRETTRQLLRDAVGIDPADVVFQRDAMADAIAAAFSAEAVTSGDQVLVSAGRSDDSPQTIGVLAHELVHVARRREPRFVPAILQDAPHNRAPGSEEALARDVERRVADRAQMVSAATSTSQDNGRQVDPPAVAARGREPWGALPAPWEPWPPATTAPSSPATTTPAAQRSFAPAPQATQPATPLRPAAQASVPLTQVHTPSSSPPMTRTHTPSSSPPMTRAHTPSSLPPTVSQPVERAEAGRITPLPAATGALPSGAATAPAQGIEPDLDALARQVYAVLKRRIAAELRRIDNT